jgi:hypothetical protein
MKKLLFCQETFAKPQILKIELVNYKHYFEEQTNGLYYKHNIIMVDACTVLWEHH